MVKVAELDSEYVSEPPLAPCATIGAPTAVPAGAFSTTDRTSSCGAGEPGAFAASVAPVPEPDQSLAPSSLDAATCTSYVVSGSRSAMVAEVAVPVTACVDHACSPCFRYRRS